jgi:hypothetical protein
MARGFLIALLAASLAGPAFGQGLGEVAAREKARRARLKEKGPVRTYTDDDLETQKRQGTPTKAAAPSNTGGESTASEPASQEESGRKRSNDEPESGRTRASETGSSESSNDWQERARAIRDEISGAQKEIAALEARIADLQLDANPNSPDLLDPNRLQKREAEKAQAISDLAKAKAALAKAEADQQKLEEDARRSGVPPRQLQ